LQLIGKLAAVSDELAEFLTRFSYDDATLKRAKRTIEMGQTQRLFEI
jgi:hypothetical protein